MKVVHILKRKHVVCYKYSDSLREEHTPDKTIAFSANVIMSDLSSLTVSTLWSPSSALVMRRYPHCHPLNPHVPN